MIFYKYRICCRKKNGVTTEFDIYGSYPTFNAIMNLQTGQFVGMVIIASDEEVQMRFYNDNGLEIGPYLRINFRFMLYNDKYGTKMIHFTNEIEAFNVVSNGFIKSEILKCSLNDFKMEFSNDFSSKFLETYLTFADMLWL